METNSNLLGGARFGPFEGYEVRAVSSGIPLPVPVGAIASASNVPDDTCAGGASAMTPGVPKTAQVLLTYGQAYEPFLKIVDRSGNKEARYRFTGPIKGYYKFLDVDLDALIEETSEAELERRLALYSDPLPGSTKYNHRSAIREWWHSFVKPRLSSAPYEDNLPPDLADAILQAMNEAGMLQKDLEAASGVDQSQISRWTTGRMQPTEKCRSEIEALERALNRAPGTFTRRCWRMMAQADHGTDKTRANAVKRKAQIEAPYTLKFHKWPLRVQKEFDHLVQVATGELVPFRGYVARTCWKVKPDKKVESEKVPAAHMLQMCLEAFFGFCLIVGVKHEHLTLALLKNTKHLKMFFEMLRARNGLNFLDAEKLVRSTKKVSGHPTKRMSSWASIIAALLRPNRGYLWQISGYASALKSTAGAETYLPYPTGQDDSHVIVVAPDGSTNDDDDEEFTIIDLKWQKQCENAYEDLSAWLRGLHKRKKIRKSNPAFDKVEWITSQEQALEPIIKGVEAIRASLPPKPTERVPKELHALRYVTRALHFQDMVFLEFSAELPLRPENMREMTFRGPNANLFKPKGSKVWWAKHKDWEKKNNKRSAVPLTERLSADIDELITVHRPYLLGEHTDYLFRLSARASTNIRKDGQPFAREMKPTDPDAPITARWYCERWNDFTARHIGRPGFAPAMMRHIVVTAWLTENPDGLLVAAAILDDTVQVVIDSYAHLQKKNLHSEYKAMFEMTVARVLTGGQAHASLEAIPFLYLEAIVAALSNAIARGQTLPDVHSTMKALLRRAKAQGGR